MKKRHYIPIAIFISLTLFSKVILFDNSHFINLDEILYFNYQILKPKKDSKILLFNTMEFNADSIARFLDTMGDSKTHYVLNLPLRDTLLKVSNNIHFAYDLSDELEYSPYNIRFHSDKKLADLYRELGIEQKLKGMAYLNYAGNYDSFLRNHLTNYDTLINKIDNKIVIIGYAGQLYDPAFERDSIETWYTPKFIMYDTVLKANIIENIVDDDFAFQLNSSYALIFGFIITLGQFGFIALRLKYSQRPYLLYKLFQFMEMSCLIIITIIGFVWNVIFPLSWLSFIVILIGEIQYWTLSVIHQKVAKKII